MTAAAPTGVTRRLLDLGILRTKPAGMERKLPLRRQLVIQAILLLITLTVLFPLIWIFSMAIDPRNLARPDGLDLIPPGASLDAFAEVIAQPTSNPISFIELALNSLKIAIASSAIAVALGITAAYAFSRLKFRGRAWLMIAVLGVLMLPSVATIIPLFIFLNQFRIEFGDLTFNLRNSLVGVTLAVIAGQLALRDLEPEGLPRHDPEGPRRGGRGRRRHAEPDLPQGRPAARDPGDRGDRVPRASSVAGRNT